MAKIEENTAIYDERQPILHKSYPSESAANSSVSENVVYTRRWYILFIFSLMAFTECCCWNTWGPIADTAKDVLGWQNSDIALLTNWGFIMYVFTAFFFSWIMDVKGLRVAVLTSGTLMAVGLAIRCIPVKPELWIWTMNIGHILLGMSGPVFASCPPLISAVWFPAHQRTTATSFSAMSSYLGTACSFLIGPYMVNQEIRPSSKTSTVLPITNLTSYWEKTDPNEQLIEINNIRNLMYIECGCGVIGLICVLIYFPPKPPLPPSTTSKIDRIDFVQGAKQIVRCGNFWILGIACATITGTYAAWITELATMLSAKDIDQNEAGWMGFYSCIGGSIIGLALGWCADHFGGKIKMVLFLLLSAGFLCFIWFLLICLKYITFNLASIYVSSILGGIAINCTFPLFFRDECRDNLSNS